MPGRIFLFLFLAVCSLSLPAQETEDASGVKKLGREVKETLDSIRLKERFKNTTQGVVISSLEAKARRQESRGDLEEATLSYLRVVTKYRELQDSLGVASTYNKIASLYARRGNPQAAKAYLGLAAKASGEDTSPDLVSLNPTGHTTGESEDPDTVVPKSTDKDNLNTDSRTNQELSRPRETSPSVQQQSRNARGYEQILSQLKAEKDSSEILRLMIEDQWKNILILRQEKDLEQAAREREERFRWTLIGGVLVALMLALLLYRQFRIKRKAHLQTQAALQNLARAHEQLKSTQTQLVESEKMASLGLLTAGVAHEINNPINFISGNIEPLKQDIAEIFQVLDKHPSLFEKEKELAYIREEVTELLKGIEEGAERTAEIVSGLRDFSRLDTADLQAFDVHVGIESTLTLLRNELKDKIEVEKSFGTLPPMEGYPGKINQVLMNVLTNAIQSISEKGTIGIITSYDAAHEHIEISILDNGKGIPENIIGKIFDPFFTTKEVGEGTGLGLAISKGIIDQHGGSIGVKSELNVGTEVKITLPLKPPEDIAS